jgi:putative addiction module component (TIGR02574 family)
MADFFAVKFMGDFDWRNQMDITLETLEAEAMKLPTLERSAFAQRLLASIDEEDEIEQAWADEVERRIAEVRSGAVQLLPLTDVLAEIRASLK